MGSIVAVLKLYPWMKIAVEAHSDATGYTCKKLTDGRAATAEKYLKSQGVTNPMAKPTGKCGVKMAVVIAGAGGSKQYVSGSKGTNTCSNGKLASASACKAAAAALGYTYSRSETDRNYPGGCYVSGTKKVYFNKADPGRAKYTATPLCKGALSCAWRLPLHGILMLSMHA